MSRVTATPAPPAAPAPRRPATAATARLRLSVIIPTWDGWDLLRSCLAALDAQERRADEVVVVDNGSTDGTPERLREAFPQVAVVALATNAGFAAAVNRGVARSSGDAVVLLNNDTVPEPGWLAALEQVALAHPAAAFVTSKMLDPSGTRIDTAGDVIDTAGMPRQRGHGEPDDGRYDVVEEVLSGCGGATLYRRAILERLGGFDERFFAYYEDADLALRGRLAGYRGLYAPSARVRHAASSTSSRHPGMKQALSARNVWWLAAKDLPAPVLVRVLPRLVAVQAGLAVMAARDGVLRPTLAGHRQALVGLPGVLADRRRIQAHRSIGPDELGRALAPARLAARGARKAARLLDRATGVLPPAVPDLDARVRYAPVLAALADVPPGPVVEVGSGSAGLAAYTDRPVIGVDYDFHATADRGQRRVLRVTGSAAALPLASASAVAVVSVDMLEHLPVQLRASAVAELVRVLAPGGRLLLTMPVGPTAQRGDARLNAAWVARTGAANPWLAEHQAFGVPTRGEVEAALRAAGARHWTARPNAQVHLWLAMQRLQLAGVSAARLDQVVAWVLAHVPARPGYRLLVEVQGEA